MTYLHREVGARHDDQSASDGSRLPLARYARPRDDAPGALPRHAGPRAALVTRRRGQARRDAVARATAARRRAFRGCRRAGGLRKGARTRSRPAWPVGRYASNRGGGGRGVRRGFELRPLLHANGGSERTAKARSATQGCEPVGRGGCRDRRGVR